MPVTLKLLALSLWLAVVPAVVQAGEFERGVEAYLAGDHLKALRIWRPLAANGDVVAMFNIGVLLAEGLGVGRDPETAARWYRIAATRGYAPAQFNLGVAYQTGNGAEKSESDAVMWWHKAAEQGHVQAQHNLGRAYMLGQGIPKDLALAKHWYQRAAAAGDTRSAEVLEDFDGLEELSESDQTSPRFAETEREVNEIMGSDVGGEDDSMVGDDPDGGASIKDESWIRDQDPTYFTIQLFAGTTEQEAREFIEGNDIVDMGAYFETTRPWYKVLYGAYADVESAEQARAALTGSLDQNTPWIRTFASVLEEMSATAADGKATAVSESNDTPESEPAGSDSARLQQGQAAFNRQNYQLAVQLWQPLAEQGLADAQYGLGFMYESGWGVSRNSQQAFSWYGRAARQGHAKSQYNLGVLYINGDGVEQDEGLGTYWIQSAADHNDTRALQFLAKMRENGTTTAAEREQRVP